MSKQDAKIDPTLIRELGALMEEAKLTEIEVERDGLRIRLARHQAPVPATRIPASPALELAENVAEEARQPTASNASSSVNTSVLPSPMVGTCYRAPEPGAPPFVEVGDAVRQGQTVMIIEAMKTMNQIAAPRTGRIVEILIDDGQPVEFGEPLLVLE